MNSLSVGLDYEAPPPLLEGRVPGKEVRLDKKISVRGIEDIVKARQYGRLLANDLGFSMTRSTLIATTISELARNIILYAKKGHILIARVCDHTREGIQITAVDHGPGIPNIQHALMSGYSSNGGLGLGLPGVKQITDEFDIQSKPGSGTEVTATIWLR